MENEVMTVSDKVVNRISKNEYGQISIDISQESTVQLISGFCEVARQVSENAFEKLTEIYSDALIKQEELELKSLENEAEIMKRFNDQVDEAMKEIDFTDSKTVDAFEKICETLRKNLLLQLNNKKKPSIFGRLFKREQV